MAVTGSGSRRPGKRWCAAAWPLRKNRRLSRPVGPAGGAAGRAAGRRPCPAAPGGRGEAEEQAACLLARQANAAGHRAELAILHTARALAALAGRTYINLEDLHTAAELALPHRRREGSEGPPRDRREGGAPQGSGADGQAGGGDGPADESHPADGPPQEGSGPAPPTEQGPSRERLEQGRTSTR
ncbi:hypothetical protein M5E87_10750 [Flavonifractor plautii]|nr:hypothetical protein M5E87_10750 [Flavonifractor plautii]